LMERRIFRIVLRGMGVYFLARGVVDWFAALAIVVQNADWMRPWSYEDMNWLYDLIGPATSTAIGIYLVSRGRFLLDCVAPVEIPRCEMCGFYQCGVFGKYCPECGTPVEVRCGASPSEEMLEGTWQAAQRRRRLGWTASLMIVARLLFATLCVGHAIYVRWDHSRDLCAC
jgi:hypothetical protein